MSCKKYIEKVISDLRELWLWLENDMGIWCQKKRVRRIVRSCEPCKSFDPANRWNRGKIQLSQFWENLAVDIMHGSNAPCLAIIDTTSPFMIWQKLRTESARGVSSCIEQVISEFGTPSYALSDNGTVFRSPVFNDVSKRWEVKQLLLCAYRPQGNGIIERSHQTVKQSVARSNISVAKAVFLCNNSSTFELMFSLQCKKPGICSTRKILNRPDLPIHSW